ncbi:RNA polymerase II transcriptional coactivator KIWI-like [Nymphaea colorata]|nr:RNA polymerase II transcriptional coactivator KIWI-like [Nymphaea colorata]
MPKRGKEREEDGNPSSGDSDGDAPAKKGAKRSFGGSSDDGVVVCEISRNRRVSVRVWQGKPTVDIREFYMKDGKQMPGKKGISLSLDQWKILRDNLEKIDKAVTENS